MKSPGILSTVAVLVIGAIMFCAKADGFFKGLYLVPFVFGPLFVSLVLAIVWRARRKSQLPLTVSSVLYLLWFAYVYRDVFYGHPDAQSPIALLFVGVYALPVMLAAWLIAWRLGRQVLAEKAN